MLVVSTWSDCQRHLPLGMCDAHMCIDEFARLASDDTEMPHEFEDELPTSAVGHTVLVVKNTKELAEALYQLADISYVLVRLQ